MSNGQETTQQTVVEIEALMEHYNVPSITFSVPRQIQGLVLPIVIVAVWEALAEAGVMPANWLPAPSIVAATLLELHRGGELLGHVGVTVARVVSGFF